MKNILITRPKDQAQELAESLEKKGFEVFVEPVFAVKKLALELNFIDVEALILTSQNAASTALDFLNKFNINKDIKIFAVGKKTAEILVKSGYCNIILPPQNLAEELLKKIISDQNITKFLYFCGKNITLNFKDELLKHGRFVEQIACYETVDIDNFSDDFLKKTTEKKFDYVLLYSQNSAKTFFDLAKKHNLLEYFQSSQILCLSEKILLLARQLGFKNSAILNKFYE